MSYKFIGYIVLSVLLAQAQTINLRGKITNGSGQGINGAVVTLLGKDLKDTTDNNGNYVIEQTTVALAPGKSNPKGNISLSKGVLELNINEPSSVKVEIFDVASNLLKEEVLPEVPTGSHQWNLADNFGTASLLIVRVTVGEVVSTIRYFPLFNGRYSAHLLSEEASSSGKRLTKALAAAAVDSLEIKASGFGTKIVDVSSFEETVDVSLNPADRWGGLGNSPVKSAGCGKELGKINKSDTYHISSAGGRGDYIVDLPNGYDKDTPYRLIFGMHCMGGTAPRVAAPDNGDDLSAYYSLKTQAEKDNIKAIYIAPQGNGDGTWNPPTDPQFFIDILDFVEENLCVDTTRVFVAGFSFGAMFSYHLSLSYPERIRAVATYAPANWHFDPQPTNRHIPIAYYQTTGTGDRTCNWIFDDGQKKGGKYCLLQHAQDNGCDTSEEIKLATSSTHVVTEFKGCNEGYPVKFSSFNGGHQAMASDPGSNVNWVEVETWEFFKQF